MTVLFVCVHNSGRSQMAEAMFNAFAKKRGVEARAESAGTDAGQEINPMAARAMEEIDIPLTGHRPKRLAEEMISKADRIITMGCGVDADRCPASFYVTEDWGLDDPAGQPIDAVRAIRDEIRARVNELLDEIALQ